MARKVLVVDDEKIIVKGIRFGLEQDGMQVDAAYDGEEALEMVKANAYDIILLDLMLPKMDGFEVCQQIREFSDVPIIMLTAKGEDIDKIMGLEYGADDYMTKPFVMEELLARIISLIRRYTMFNQNGNEAKTLNYDGLMIDLDTRSFTTEKGTFELPPKEFDLLLFCAKNQGRIMTKQQIYEKVWGEPYVYDDSNIMSVISRLRKKLETDPGNPKYIQTVKGIGYRFNKEV